MFDIQIAETKWVSIAAIVIFAAMFASMTVTDISKNNAQRHCLASYAATDRSAEEIEQICK